jgi:Tol biopolymer transport system component
LIAFLAGAALTYWLAQPKPQEPLKMTTLTYSGKDYSPAISPDGKLISFCSERNGTPQIWIKQFVGGSEVVLTSGNDDFPRFSPDGSTIYFIRTINELSSLYRIPIVGGVERKILEDVRSADCSPDGKQIAFVRWKSGDSTLFTANKDGSGIQQVGIFKGKVLQHPRWSPDSKQIAIVQIFSNNTPNLESILTIDLATKKQRWITSTWPTLAIWTSEKQILYGVSESATVMGPVSVRLSGKIVIQNILSQNIRSLFWFPSSGDVLDIEKNGGILLNNYLTRQNLRQVAIKDNVAERWFTQGNSIDRQPVYSPDGERILFSSIGSGNLDLVEMVIRTGELRRITEDAADDWDPAYSRDGKHILWSSTRSGHYEVWMADADGSNARQITNDGVDAENPSLTPDNKWIFYNTYNAENQGIWKIHPDGSGAVKFIPGLTQFPEISPDGKFLAYASFKESFADTSGNLNVIDLETKASVFQIKTGIKRDIRSITFQGAAGRCRWLPDGKAIAYIDANESNQLGVYVQDFVPNKDTYNTRRPVAGFNSSKFTETFGISPDGAFITIAEMEVLSNLVLAENAPAFNR